MNIIQNIQSIIAVAGLILLILAAVARGVKVIVRSIQDIKGATEIGRASCRERV